MSRPHIPLRRRVLYGAAMLLLVAVLVEGVARLVWSEADLVMNPRLSYLQDEPTLLWSMRPGVDMELEEGFHLQTNSLGLRDHEIVTPKPEGTVRILSLGESTSWGHGVALEETYAKVLESRLTRSEERFEVINAGVGGYTSWQSAIYLEERGVELQPDVVLVYHLHNDRLPRGVVDENNFLYQVLYTDAEFYARRKPFRYLLWGLYKSHLYRRLRQQVLRLPTDLPNFATARGIRDYRLTDPERKAAFWRIYQTCQENGIRLVVLMPTYQGHPGHDYIIRDFARQSGTSLIRLPDRKTEAAVSDEQFYLDAVHPSVQGHALIAQWIEEALLEGGDSWWLP